MSLANIKDKLIIRQMSEDDFDSVKRLELVCGLSFWSIEDYRTSLNNSDYIMLIAQHSEKIIGFIIARLITIHDNIFKFELDKKICEIEIYNMAVEANYRRKGIGRLMLESCISLLTKPAKVIFQLEVRKSNKEAIEFYSRLGFTIQGIRKQFYRNPCEDGLNMFLEKNYMS